MSNVTTLANVENNEEKSIFEIVNKTAGFHESVLLEARTAFKV